MEILFEDLLDQETSTDIVSDITKTTPYMLRNDGALLGCGDVHPYIKMFYKDDFETNYDSLLKHATHLRWFYNNTLSENTKNLIIKLLYLSYGKNEEIDNLIQELQIKNIIIDENIIDVFKALNDATNQEFCRVRTSNFKYAYGGDNGEIYFRLSSIGFNWFDLIWKTVMRFKSNIKYVTIMRDYATFGKQFDYFRYKGIVFNKLPVDEFLTIPGEPVLECMSKDNIVETIMLEAPEKHDTLNPKLFGEDEKLKPEVREKLLEIAQDFMDGLIEDEIKFDLNDIVIVGSNCSYNYNSKSDIDVHLRFNTDTLSCPDNLYPLLYGAYRSIWNKNHEVSIYGIPVELFVETDQDVEQSEVVATDSENGLLTDNEKTVPLDEARQVVAKLVSNGIYSILKDEWVKHPVKEDIPDIDQDMFDNVLSKWEDRYEKRIKDPDIESIDDFMADIYEVRKQSIARDGEYGIGNLVFKELRNKEYFNNLRQLKIDLINKNLSLESLDTRDSYDTDFDTSDFEDK